jgi:ferric-dicitrate binding protein FerR (iron transport regulator)
MREKDTGMSASTFAATAAPTPTSNAGYQPGVCNIGPEEIARRRRAGHVGLLVTLAVLAVLVVSHAPPLARLIAILPAAGSASGYLQAWLKFCAGFGSRGIFNFGQLGETTAVENADARARDRRRSRQIGLASLGIGVAVGIVAVLLPV